MFSLATTWCKAVRIYWYVSITEDQTHNDKVFQVSYSQYCHCCTAQKSSTSRWPPACLTSPVGPTLTQYQRQTTAALACMLHWSDTQVFSNEEARYSGIGPFWSILQDRLLYYTKKLCYHWQLLMQLYAACSACSELFSAMCNPKAPVANTG